ncbi:DoxX family protein [Goodfellowiella coeruleoviolacea]|uniref:Oxidoreductase n=1 Tax=Goodfellowiella coeruleoviolacea TaxID=334858 RepID=A0AAE3GI21_9PSEU|nr:DoxX family protein [Goodfellowiella coeruleoviolacea]MCP2168550.1 putative oxidoreductase [Goodfellowiella coeruleoviolacea]
MELLDKNKGHVLALFRIVVGLLFACHGAATLFGVLGGVRGRAPGFAEWPGWWAAAIQLAGGVLVLLGLATRVAATICSGSMAYAYFFVHQPDGLFPIQNGGEAAAMFCWAFLLIVFLGPGTLALDSLFSRKQSAGGQRSSVAEPAPLQQPTA